MCFNHPRIRSQLLISSSSVPVLCDVPSTRIVTFTLMSTRQVATKLYRLRILVKAGTEDRAPVGTRVLI